MQVQILLPSLMPMATTIITHASPAFRIKNKGRSSMQKGIRLGDEVRQELVIVRKLYYNKTVRQKYNVSSI